MITFIIYTKSKSELAVIKKISYDVSSLISDEDLKIYGMTDFKQVDEFLKKTPVIDISCIDVCEENGIASAEHIRSLNSNMLIIVIANTDVSPSKYIIPTIMPGSLLIRPFDVNTLKSVFMTAFAEYYKSFLKEDGTHGFVIENRDGRWVVPYERIVCFESRAKKIILETENEEYSFYDTLDNLESSLNENFIRCHRSFIVAKKRIKKIYYSKNFILLDNDYEIPLSRSYKSKLKESVI